MVFSSHLKIDADRWSLQVQSYRFGNHVPEQAGPTCTFVYRVTELLSYSIHLLHTSSTLLLLSFRVEAAETSAGALLSKGGEGICPAANHTAARLLTPGLPPLPGEWEGVEWHASSTLCCMERKVGVFQKAQVLQNHVLNGKPEIWQPHTWVITSCIFGPLP